MSEAGDGSVGLMGIINKQSPMTMFLVQPLTQRASMMVSFLKHGWNLELLLKIKNHISLCVIFLTGHNMLTYID